MKLTDEQRAALTNALRAFAATGDGDGCDEIAFLAGCAWQREQDAKLCESRARICAELGLHDDMVRRDGWLGAADAIRAQGDDRG